MINVYKINNEKFKSIYFSINFTMQVTKGEISKNSLLAKMLLKSCEKYQTEKEMQKRLYSLYGSNFDIGVEKLGDLYNIEFRAECINKKYLPENIDVVDDILRFMYNVIYKPNITEKKFNEDLFIREKENLVDKIREVKDDKLRFGIRKMEELMCENEPFGVYVYGSEDDVLSISNEELYKTYEKLINDSLVTVIVSGNLNGYEDIDTRINSIFEDILSSNLDQNSLVYNIKSKYSKEEIVESQQTTQSVISYGIRLSDVDEIDFYAINVYNAILGGTPSSKLFQNFREKESLAYTVRSRYYRFKDIIIIYAGINKENYEKAKTVIEEQINDIKNGHITDEEFNASKQSLISDLKEWNDSKISLSKMLMSNLIVNKNSDASISHMVSNLEKVTKDDVVKIANKIKIEKIYFLGGDIDA